MNNCLRKYVYYFLVFFSFHIQANGYSWDIENETVSLNSLGKKPLFVSLGSHCEIALALKRNMIRSAAFPFDWCLTLNNDLLIDILENDFQYFLDDEYLFYDDNWTINVNKHNRLLNTKYQIEFLHEGEWNEDRFDEMVKSFKAKYLRRITRFRSLKDYKGKVFFFRIAFERSLEDRRKYPCSENIEIK